MSHYLNVASVDTPVAIYSKARVQIDEIAREVRIMDRAGSTLQLAHFNDGFELVAVNNNPLTFEIETSLGTIEVVKGGGCGGCGGGTQVVPK